MSQLINQSVGQSTSQPVGQTVTQSVRQLLSKSVNQSASRLVRQLGSQSINHLLPLVNQKISQTNNQLVSLSVGQPVKWIEHTPLKIRILHNLCTPSLSQNTWATDISTSTRLTCRSKYWPKHNQYVGQYIDRYIRKPVDWHIKRLSVNILPVWRLTLGRYGDLSNNVGGISVNCRWNID